MKNRWKICRLFGRSAITPMVRGNHYY